MSEVVAALTHIQVWVCNLCLDGAGGECHVPGCEFYAAPAPAGDELAQLREWRDRYRAEL